MKDYYALMGVFASTVRAERPTFAVEPDIEQEYMWLQRKLFDLAYSINLLGNEGTTFTNGAEKAVEWKAEMEGLKARATTNLAKYPQLIQSLDKYWNPPRRAAAPPPRPPAAAAAGAKVPAAPAAAAQPAARPGAPSTDPYMNAVFEAAQYVDASDPTYTWITYKPGEVRNMPILQSRQRRGARRDRASRVPGGACAAAMTRRSRTARAGSSWRNASSPIRQPWLPA